MSLSSSFCSIVAAGRRHDGAKLPRCASSSTANANRLWWPACNQPPFLCCRWVQDRHDHSCLMMHRSAALRVDGTMPCVALTTLTARSSLVQQDAAEA